MAVRYLHITGRRVSALMRLESRFGEPIAAASRPSWETGNLRGRNRGARGYRRPGQGHDVI